MQALEEAIPDWQLNISRNLGVFSCTTVLICMRGLPIWLEDRTNVPLVSCTAVLYIASAYLYYAAVNYLPLATAQSTTKTVSLTIGVIMFRVWLKEKLTVLKCISILLCWGGIVAIIQPSFTVGLFDDGSDSLVNTSLYGIIPVLDNVAAPEETAKHNQAHHKLFRPNHGLSAFFQNHFYHHKGKLTFFDYFSDTILTKAAQTDSSSPLQQHTLTQKLIFGYLFIVCHGIVTSTRYLNYKLVRRRDISTFLVIFWGSLAGIILSTVMTFSIEKPVVPSDAKQVVLMLGHGFSIGLQHVCQVFQAQYLELTVVTILTVSSGLFFMTMFQYTFLHNIMPGHRNLLEICGILLVVYGATQTALSELCKGNLKCCTCGGKSLEKV